MANDIATMDMGVLKKRVAEHIQATIGAFLEPDVFQKMVEEAVAEFFEKPVLMGFEEYSYVVNPEAKDWQQRKEKRYRAVYPCTPFKMMVWHACEEIAHAALATYFKDAQAENENRMKNLLKDAGLDKITQANVDLFVQKTRELHTARAVTEGMAIFKASLLSAIARSGGANSPMYHEICNMPIPSVE